MFLPTHFPSTNFVGLSLPLAFAFGPYFRRVAACVLSSHPPILKLSSGHGWANVVAVARIYLPSHCG